MYVPFVGTWLIFGIVLLPVYTILLGWFLGKPRNLRLSLLGVGYVIAMASLLWSGLALMSFIARLLFL
ncbi:MAG: hypothetical protein Q7R39_00845 [Dehalococcoidia bacterium]|nr:hypothetical protein [Dehalococcoidia bacterium]